MKTFSTFMMSLVVMALSLTSCAKKVDSPAGELAADLNAFADKIAACQSWDDFQTLGAEDDAFEKYRDVDYTLTAEDKEVLVDATKKISKVLIEKISELAGEEIEDGATEQAMEQIERLINDCETLNDFVNMNHRGF